MHLGFRTDLPLAGMSDLHQVRTRRPDPRQDANHGQMLGSARPLRARAALAYTVVVVGRAVERPHALNGAGSHVVADDIQHHQQPWGRAGGEAGSGEAGSKLGRQRKCEAGSRADGRNTARPARKCAHPRRAPFARIPSCLPPCLCVAQSSRGLCAQREVARTHGLKPQKGAQTRPRPASRARWLACAAAPPPRSALRARTP